MKSFIRLSGIAVLLLGSAGLAAQQSDPVLTAMQQELARSFANLKKAPLPPYLPPAEKARQQLVRIQRPLFFFEYSAVNPLFI